MKQKDYKTVNGTQMRFYKKLDDMFLMLDPKNNIHKYTSNGKVVGDGYSHSMDLVI